MFLSGVLLALTFTILDVAVSTPLQNEKIDPVDLYHQCFRVTEKEKDNNKSPVLLIHGLSSSHLDWNGVYEVIALGTGRQVCTVDLRNHGDSPWNNRSDVEAMTVDIKHFLDQRNIKKVNIVGHSLGGKVAVHFALKYPDRVDSVVVEDMRPNNVNNQAFLLVQNFMKLLKEAIKSVPDGSNEQEAKLAIVAIIRKKVVESGIDEKPDFGPNSVSIRLVDGKWQYKVNVDVMLKAFDNPEEFLTPSTGLFKGPVLFIYGAESAFDVAGDEKNIMKLFPNAKLVPVKGARHQIHRLFKQFDEEVINFLIKIK